MGGAGTTELGEVVPCLNGGVEERVGCFGRGGVEAGCGRGVRGVHGNGAAIVVAAAAAGGNGHRGGGVCWCAHDGLVVAESREEVSRERVEDDLG